jgi:LmbE family N-acetylglucosaminyl deacetylase
MSRSSSRRNFIKQSTAGIGLLSVGSLLEERSPKGAKKLKVCCLGGHPDDPESGCGGVLARFAQAGASVSIIYLTRGEAGIEGKTHAESAAIRSREAEEACQILGAKPIFAGQTDGDTVLSNDSLRQMQEIIASQSPDILFTHWPIDTHKDHQTASLLAIQTWVRGGHPFDLYFFEVCAGAQTMTFSPTDYVDISAVQELKRKAVFCHVSQDPSGIYACGHEVMEDFRGREIGARAAEAFVRMKTTASEIMGNWPMV